MRQMAPLQDRPQAKVAPKAPKPVGKGKRSATPSRPLLVPERVLPRIQAPNEPGLTGRGLPDGVTVDHSESAQQQLSAANAHAAARGSRILASPGAFDGGAGRERLAHEIAHVIQQGPSARSLPRAVGGQAEADARAFARASLAGGDPRVTVSAPLGWAYDRKTIASGDLVVRVTIVGRHARVEMRHPDDERYVLEYSVTHNIPARNELYTIVKGSGIPELPPNRHAFFRFETKGDEPILERKSFPDKVDLLVLKNAPAAPSVGAGGDAGQTQSGTGTKPGAHPGTGGPKGAGSGHGSTGPQAGTKAPPAGSPPIGSPPTGSLPPEAAPPQPGDANVPTVTVTDAKQIEELKRRGLVPATSADQMKAKIANHEPLSFEEAVALVDGLNQVVGEGDKKQSQEARESWLKWAEFVKANKDKISGQAKSGGDEGLKVEDVQEILKKEKEFVGVREGLGKTASQAMHDPERRKSWNSLAPWERQLWQDYVDKFGDAPDPTDASSSDDLHLTASVRTSMALRMSPKYMPAGMRDAAVAMFNDPIFIGTTIASITAYLALWVVPEPVFTKATAIVTTIGLMSLGAFSVSEIVNLAGAWMQLDEDAGKATTLAELDDAAKKFGHSIGGSGMRILLVLATLLASKALPMRKAPTGIGGEPPPPVPKGGAAPPAPPRAPVELRVIKGGRGGGSIVSGPRGGTVASGGRGGPSAARALDLEPAPAEPAPARHLQPVPDEPLPTPTPATTASTPGPKTGTGTSTGPAQLPVPVPAPQPAPQPKQPSGAKVADSNIFMDRPEQGMAQRIRIDTLYLSNPNITLHVPASAIAEVLAGDKFGTQAPRLVGKPGGAAIHPDIDGDITPYLSDLKDIVSGPFGETDFKIALRAKERGLPLLTANSKMAQQVRNPNLPKRVAAVGMVVVEIP